jgi:hypothetical protein
MKIMEGSLEVGDMLVNKKEKEIVLYLTSLHASSLNIRKRSLSELSEVLVG